MDLAAQCWWQARSLHFITNFTLNSLCNFLSDERFLGLQDVVPSHLICEDLLIVPNVMVDNFSTVYLENYFVYLHFKVPVYCI